MCTFTQKEGENWGRGLNCFSRIWHLSFGPEFWVLEFCSSVLLPTKPSHLSSHNKWMESKVECFLALACWLMTSCSSPAHVAAASKRTRAADQSINQSYALGKSPGIYWGTDLELHSNHFWNDGHCGVQVWRLTLVLLTQHISFRQCIQARGKGFFVCRSICSTHGTALIYASDTHAAANELLFWISARKKQSLFFRLLCSLCFPSHKKPRAGSVFTDTSKWRLFFNSCFTSVCQLNGLINNVGH